MRIFLAVLIACLVCCVAVPPTTGGVLSHSQCSLRWQAQSFPLEVVVDRRFSSEQQDALQEAILDWNEAVGSDVFTLQREIDWWDSEIQNPHTNTIYVLLADIPDDPPSVIQGLSIVHDDSCYIDRALVFFDVAVPDGDAMLVFMHELGHTLGLAHDPDWQPSIMYPYANTSGGRILMDDINFVRWETTHDYQGNSSLPASNAVTFD